MYTTKNRVVYPYRVEEIHFAQESDEEERAIDIKDEDCCDAIRYTTVRLNDGHRVQLAQESYLRKYIPYSQDTVAVCNIGGYGTAQMLAPCSIQEYHPSSNEYIVRVEGEEEEQNLPVDKLLRNA